MGPCVGFAFLMLLCRIGTTTEDRVEYDYYKYHPMIEITSWMKQIVSEYPSLVSIVAYGKTYENKTLNLLKIGKSTGETKERKKAIWMDCGIHAREWIAPAFCQYFVREILQAYKTDPKMNETMKNMDFYVTPVLNVDGYIYSWKDNTTRLWRKSRSPGPEDCQCFGGTDLNRNFDSNWGTTWAVSHDCCSPIYCGPKALSEPEARAVTDFIGGMKDNVLCYLTIHSYGSLILLPYGNPNVTAPNYNELMEVGLAAADAIKEVHGLKFTVGTSSDILYPHSGSSRDWARQVGIPFSFTFELRGGRHGFELPEDQIKPACEEAYAGAMHIIRHVHDMNFGPRSAAVLTATAMLWTTMLPAFVTGTAAL